MTNETTHRDNRSPDEIERDIKRTQDDMSRTVDRLGDQFTPRNLVNALFDKAEANDVQARALYDGARRNPLALGLLSAGAIWLVSDYDAHPRAFRSFNDDHDSDDDTLLLDDSHEREHQAYLEHMNRVERRENEDHEIYQRRRDDARANYLMIERRHEEDDKRYRERLDEATEGMRQKRHEMADNARRKRDEAMSKARETGSRLSSKSRRGAQRATDMYEDNPLIGGAIAAIVGLIAGSAAPATRTEREYLGDHAEHSLDQAKHQAEDAAHKAREKKDEAVEKADRKVDPDRDDSTGRSSAQREAVTLNG
ncbi:MAG: DUF3618 domain-containing protein [Erythrobacter sp.]|uniref:DUF3618 domain-containing protein n=1 Tax=Erythrobacter sp. TaxID=1042 RepID=UPI003C77B3AC